MNNGKTHARPLYFDYAATTPVDTKVAEAMVACLTQEGNFGNPASTTHLYGWQAREAVELATQQVASLIGAKPGELVWTSGATESTNLALKGVAKSIAPNGGHIITSKTEHKSVLDTCCALEKKGYKVTYLTPNREGLFSLSDIENAVTENTFLVSIMHVNNETGVIQKVSEIGTFCHERQILFHVDGAQSLGKLPINVHDAKIDLMSFSGHKLYGPKGVGILYVSQDSELALEPLLHGGGHQKGMRSGTLPTHQIVGMGKACELAKDAMPEEQNKISSLAERFWLGIKNIEGIHLNGALKQKVPNIFNISFKDVNGEALLSVLRPLAISTGSACTSEAATTSHVLRGMGLGTDCLSAAIRLSFGRYTSVEEVDFAVELINQEATKLRSSMPLWRL